MAGIEFQVTVNDKEEVLRLLQEVEERTLEDWGAFAEGVAIGLCPVDTSNLKNHISHVVELPDHCVDMGTNVEYAVFVEYGTGKYAEEGNGRPTPWAYQDKDGNWVWTAGQQPQPFIRPAISEHTEDYKEILYENLQNA